MIAQERPDYLLKSFSGDTRAAFVICAHFHKLLIDVRRWLMVIILMKMCQNVTFMITNKAAIVFFQHNAHYVM